MGDPAEKEWLAGVDGCRGGWFAVLARFDARLVPLETRFALEADFSALLALAERPAVIALDIPIGLLEAAQPGGRVCDREARRLLGRERQASVFTPPTRSALEARTYRQALALNGAGLSKQAFHILPKIREVDRVMTPARQGQVFEAHPELAFLRLAGRPMGHNKKTPEGQKERQRWLKRCYGRHFVAPQALRDRFGAGRLAPDDILDAYALSRVAARIRGSLALRLPAGDPPRDGKGLRMEIWY